MKLKRDKKLTTVKWEYLQKNLFVDQNVTILPLQETHISDNEHLKSWTSYPCALSFTINTE